MEARTEDRLEEAGEILARMREQVSRAVVGQQAVVRELLICLAAAGHALVEGVPGLGKTLLVLSLSRTFSGRFARVQFTPDLMPADVTGHSIFDSESGQFRLRRGPAFTHLLLADEINRAPAKTQAALLEVMQEGAITIDGTTHALEPPFMTVATQNPVEMDGTYPLPEAQLDRFLMKIRVDYPAEEQEVDLVTRVTDHHRGDRLDVSAVEAVASPESIREIQDRVGAMTVDPRITEYAVRLVRAARASARLRMGPGPRGAIALVRAARGHALLEGRTYVTPDDVKALAVPCLAHRVLANPELEIEGISAERTIGEIAAEVEAPRT